MSKLILYDFECPTHGLFEDLVHSHEFETPCPECGLKAKRQVSTFHIDHMKMATSASASPESIIKFDRAHRQQKAKEERSEREHGPMEYGKAPGSD